MQGITPKSQDSKFFTCHRMGAKPSAKFKAKHIGVSVAKPDDEAPSGEVSDATETPRGNEVGN